MKSTLFAVSSLLLLSTAFGAHSAMAADLIVDEPAVAAATANWANFYVEVYGGATLQGNSTYEGSDYDMDPAAAFGASFGLMTPVPGLAVELDVMRAGGNYTGYDYGVITTSLMVDAEYSVPLNDMFDLYATAGVGVINAVYDEDYSGTGAGYQLGIGARAHVTDNVSVFGEVKYQNSFDVIDADGVDIQYPTVNALVGLRFSF